MSNSCNARRQTGEIVTRDELTTSLIEPDARISKRPASEGTGLRLLAPSLTSFRLLSSQLYFFTGNQRRTANQQLY